MTSPPSATTLSSYPTTPILSTHAVTQRIAFVLVVRPLRDYISRIATRKPAVIGPAAETAVLYHLAPPSQNPFKPLACPADRRALEVRLLWRCLIFRSARFLLTVSQC